MIRHAFAWLLLFLGANATAVCNNPKDWLESPVDGIKVFVGYRHDRPNDSLPYSSENHQEKLYIGFPPPLSQAMLDQPWPGKLTEKEETGRDSWEEKKGRYVSYFEPDGKGQWRLCREEYWSLKTTDRRVDWSEKYAISDAAHWNNPILAPWLKTHFSILASIFLYDKQGRLVESFNSLKSRLDSNETGVYECWRYDDKNRITLQLNANQSKVCPKGEPDLRDNFYRRIYFDFAEPDGTPTYRTSWDETHTGNKKDGWAKTISFSKLIDPKNPNPDERYQGGNARADAKHGVLRILGGYRLGEKENSIGPTFKYASGGEPPIEYFFTNPPVPVEMLKDPENIYKYDRRRDTDIVGRSIKLYEYFPANQTRTRERFFAAFGRTLRHEQLDDEGRLRRAINVGRFSRTDEEFGFYDEDIKHAKISLKLKGHELYYRVWDYDAAGKATLVALGWGNRLSLGKPEKIDDAKIVFGTPDGTVRWKSKEDFFRAFDFDPKASRVFAGLYEPL